MLKIFGKLHIACREKSSWQYFFVFRKYWKIAPLQGWKYPQNLQQSISISSDKNNITLYLFINWIFNYCYLNGLLSRHFQLLKTFYFQKFLKNEQLVELICYLKGSLFGYIQPLKRGDFRMFSKNKKNIVILIFTTSNMLLAKYF